MAEQADRGYIVSFCLVALFLALPILGLTSSEFNGEIEILKSESHRKDTSPGHYTNSSAPNGQSPCPPGTYQPTPNESSCIETSPGYYAAGSYQYEGFESGNLIGLFDNWTISSSLLDYNNPTNYLSSWQPTNLGECNVNSTVWCIQSNLSLNGGYSLRIGDDN